MPAPARDASVISTCGIDGTSPGADTKRGSPTRGETSNRADRNCEEDEESTQACAPSGVWIGPWIVKGRCPRSP